MDDMQGYRYLELGETIQDGDEILYCKNGWVNVCTIIGEPCLNTSSFRRKIKSEKTDFDTLKEAFDKIGVRYNISGSNTIIMTNLIAFLFNEEGKLINEGKVVNIS